VGLNLIKFAAQVEVAKGPKPSNTFWMPHSGSTVSNGVDDLFYFIYYLCLFFFVLIVGAMVYFVVKYKRRSPDQKSSPNKGNHTLELVWSVIPSILLIVIFAWGFKDWVKLVVPPANALEVRVTGQKWSWSYDYVSSGVNASNLVVPEGKPVKLIMSSKDVIHSYFVPDFRIKKDVLPGRYTVTWFEPTGLGEHAVLCTEYCGTSHSGMLSKVKVVPQQEFEEWIAGGGDLGGEGVPLSQLGAKLYEAKGCNACHSIDGSAKVGPTFKGIYGREGEFVDGKKYKADDNYIRNSILVPASEIVKGYAPAMPSYQGQLNEKQLSALIEYMKEISK
jgi:cytochrome c oxidase subunit II